MHSNVVVALADISGIVSGPKETPRRMIMVRSSSNEISTDQLEIGSVFKSGKLRNQRFPYCPQYFMVPV
jgi:hypothetical protein